MQVDQLNLVESANYICFENEHRFYIFGKFKVRDFHKKFTKKCNCDDPNIKPKV